MTSSLAVCRTLLAAVVWTAGGAALLHGASTWLGVDRVIRDVGSTQRVDIVWLGLVSCLACVATLTSYLLGAAVARAAGHPWWSTIGLVGTTLAVPGAVLFGVLDRAGASWPYLLMPLVVGAGIGLVSGAVFTLQRGSSGGSDLERAGSTGSGRSWGSR